MAKKSAKPKTEPEPAAVPGGPTIDAVERWAARQEAGRKVKRPTSTAERIAVLTTYLENRLAYARPFDELEPLLDAQGRVVGGPVAALLERCELQPDEILLTLGDFGDLVAEDPETDVLKSLAECLEVQPEAESSDDAGAAEDDDEGTADDDAADEDEDADEDAEEDEDGDEAEDEDEEEVEAEEPAPPTKAKGKAKGKGKPAAEEAPEPAAAPEKKAKKPKEDPLKGKPVLYRPPTVDKVVKGTVLESSDTRISLRDEQGKTWTNIKRSLCEFPEGDPQKGKAAEKNEERKPVRVTLKLAAKKLPQLERILRERRGQPMPKVKVGETVPEYETSSVVKLGEHKYEFLMDLVNGENGPYLDLYGRRAGDEKDVIHEPIIEGPKDGTVYRLEIRGRVFDVVLTAA